MHDFDARQFPAAHFGGAELRNAAREFRSVQIANPYHVAGGKFTFAARHPRRQEALALLAQGQLRAVIHEQRALG